MAGGGGMAWGVAPAGSGGTGPGAGGMASVVAPAGSGATGPGAGGTAAVRVPGAGKLVVVGRVVALRVLEVQRRPADPAAGPAEKTEGGLGGVGRFPGPAVEAGLSAG